MIKLNKNELQLFYQYVDLNNPKPELNCLVAKDGYLYATDTRAAIRKKVDANEYLSIHKKVIESSLKVRGATTFELHDKTIICRDKEDEEIVTVSKKHIFNNPVDINRVYKEDFEKEVRFNNETQISGILALNGITIAPKHIPKKIDDELHGFVKMKAKKEPVLISFKASEFSQYTTEIIVMPIFDNYLFKNGELKIGGTIW